MAWSAPAIARPSTSCRPPAGHAPAPPSQARYREAPARGSSPRSRVSPTVSRETPPSPRHDRRSAASEAAPRASPPARTRPPAGNRGAPAGTAFRARCGGSPWLRYGNSSFALSWSIALANPCCAGSQAIEPRFARRIAPMRRLSARRTKSLAAQGWRACSTEKGFRLCGPGEVALSHRRPPPLGSGPAASRGGWVSACLLCGTKFIRHSSKDWHYAG